MDVSSFIAKKPSLVEKVICFPTDTVYGIGCLYNDSVAIERIYQLKKRDISKKLPVLVSGIADLKTLGVTITEPMAKLINDHWPGALTVIAKREEETIAVRMPDSFVALELIKAYGPLATTSANVSNEKEINDIQLLQEKFSTAIDYYITDVTDFSAVASTVVDCTGSQLKVVRQGAVHI
jgi:L-threonylcarbamoyladenylate synthase